MNEENKKYLRWLQLIQKRAWYGVVFIASVLISASGFATIDVLYVNHVTKELKWSDSEYPTFWIGWEPLKGDPSMYYLEEQQLLNKGYGYTSFPAKIEVFIIVLILLLVAVLIFFKNRKRFNTNRNIR